MRRYILLPPLGGLLGAMTFFFVEAGIFVLQGQGSQPVNSESSHAIYSIAFLSGFASREVTTKLRMIAEATFAKAPEAESTRDRSEGEQ